MVLENTEISILVGPSVGLTDHRLVGARCSPRRFLLAEIMIGFCQLISMIEFHHLSSHRLFDLVTFAHLPICNPSCFLIFPTPLDSPVDLSVNLSGLVLTGGYYHDLERYHDFVVEIMYFFIHDFYCKIMIML